MGKSDLFCRHARVWRCLRPAVRGIVAAIYNYRGEVCRIDSPALILTNHCAELDPGFIMSSFRKQAYFVTSEHILRKGLISKAVIWLQDPIARQKGGSAVSAVREIVTRIRNGCSVCLYPEGNRTWDGVTAPFPPATAKLARACGGTLVTYRTSGAYFANPRWAGSRIRRGRVEGRVMGIYPPEKLKDMSVSEIEELIARDLYEDAWARQREKPVEFRGRRLAEHLETLLYLCPKCGALHRMESRGDYFACRDCGYTVRYLPTGFFGGERVIYDTVREWKLRQDEKLRELCAGAGNGLIFEDGGIDLYEIETARAAKFIAGGELRLYGNRLELPGALCVPVSEISGMALRGPTALFIGFGGHSYELRPRGASCTHKYLEACLELGAPIAFGV